MAEFSELTVRYRLLMKAYRWRTIIPTPWANLRVPLSRARVAIVTSAALYRPGIDRPFSVDEGAGGEAEATVRYLPSDVDLTSLAIGQTSGSFDRAAIERDRNLALPLDRLRELCDAGLVGSVAPRHVSFNGSMLAPGRFLRECAPEVADVLRADEVDAALFVPV